MVFYDCEHVKISKKLLAINSSLKILAEKVFKTARATDNKFQFIDYDICAWRLVDLNLLTEFVFEEEGSSVNVSMVFTTGVIVIEIGSAVDLARIVYKNGLDLNVIKLMT